jgi:hypothetical protein
LAQVHIAAAGCAGSLCSLQLSSVCGQQGTRVQGSSWCVVCQQKRCQSSSKLLLAGIQGRLFQPADAIADAATIKEYTCFLRWVPKVEAALAGACGLFAQRAVHVMTGQMERTHLLHVFVCACA